MANTTIGFGAALVLLGVVGYVASGSASPTALIPAGFGLAMALLGLLARSEARRKHAMHGAALIGLLGVLGSARGLAQLPTLLSGGEVARPAAVISQSLMAILLLVFVGLTVRSFVLARRRRATA